MTQGFSRLACVCAFGQAQAYRIIRSSDQEAIYHQGRVKACQVGIKKKRFCTGFGSVIADVLDHGRVGSTGLFGKRLRGMSADSGNVLERNCSSRRTPGSHMTASSKSASEDGAGSDPKNGSKKQKVGRRQYTGDPMAGPKIIPTAAPESYGNTGTAILWFRNDLRVSDNAALALANTAEYVVPVYVFDKQWYGMDNASPHGFQRIGPFQANFIKQSVKNLRNLLRLKISELVFRVGCTEDCIGEIAQILIDNDLGPVRVVAHKEVTRDETEMEERVSDVLAEISEDNELPERIPLHFVWGATLIHLDDLGFNPAGPALPATFTEFRKLVEREGKCRIREEIPEPQQMCNYPREITIPSDQLPSLRDDLEVKGLADPHDYPFPHPLAVITYKGGEEHGLKRIKMWMWSQNCLQSYFETRNQSGHMDFSSKFSAWMAIGCLSPRTIYWNCKQYEEKVVKNKSTYWMVFELLTRDYFRWVAARAKNKLFALNGFTGKGASERSVWKVPPGTISEEHQRRFEAWVRGMTGAPYVDCSMRELAATGYMSNRGRQNAASFLIHDLEYPDWRAGAEYFESVLIDHDVASNWGNWAYLAGVGSDPRGGRRFNVIKQAMQYDATGWYTKRWCGELWRLPPPLVHHPHTLSDEELTALDVEPGKTYPRPIVSLPPVPDRVRAAAPPPPQAQVFDLNALDDDEESEQRRDMLCEEMRPEDDNATHEQLKQISRDITWFAVPEGDPNYAQSLTPEELAAREEAKRYE